MTLLAAGSGFYMVYRLEMWSRFLDFAFWWMHAMVAVWAVFTLVLFVFEPLFLHRRFIERARKEPEKTFALVQHLHRVLATISLITAAAAVAGAGPGAGQRAAGDRSGRRARVFLRAAGSERGSRPAHLGAEHDGSRADGTRDQTGGYGR